MDCLIKALGADCDGELKERILFGQLKVAACDKHYRSHLVILALNKGSLSTDEILSIGHDERETKLAEFAESSEKTIQLLLDEAKALDEKFK